MSKKRSIFIADQANDEDEEEDAVRGDDGEEEDEAGRTWLGSSPTRSNATSAALTWPDGDLRRSVAGGGAGGAAEERYAALGAARARRGGRYHEPGFRAAVQAG